MFYIQKMQENSNWNVLVINVWPSALIWKNYHNVKTVNVVTQIFGRFVGYVCLEILRCYSGSILMKVSDIVMHVMKLFDEV